MRGTHLCEDLVQPLQGPMQVYLNPAGGAGHILAVVFCSPALKRGHSKVLKYSKSTLGNSSITVYCLKKKILEWMEFKTGSSTKKFREGGGWRMHSSLMVNHLSQFDSTFTKLMRMVHIFVSS